MNDQPQTAPAPKDGGVLLFARNFFRHPFMLGSIVPSSRFLIRELLAPVNWRRARVIVEYGPGVGGITAEVLRRMRPDAMLIAIETNADFVRYLRDTLHDARLKVVDGSAEAIGEILGRFGQQHADYIISGIPLGSMPAPLRQSIVRNTRAALAPDGTFLVYQFTTRVFEDLKRTFGYVGRKFEPLNVLPAYLFFCQSGTA